MEPELICDVCGTTEGVRETYEPYAAEIRGEFIEMTLCWECDLDLAQDI
ncbi:hypothetical protein [Streptomyces sp. 5-10]|nr:hypothetical protein [Streptomyces sp. 5-10]MBD3004570.1 hypothetical protein [Streptomyces sp. 5-10]